MPKKKLTKAQVKRKIKTMNRVLYDLMIDRMAYTSKSECKMTFEKMMSFKKYATSAADKV